jgi:phosphatidylglycerophosphate synthase
MPSAPGNRYDFSDASVVRPWLTRVWFERLFPLLPRAMAANVVTLLSTGLLLAVLAGALLVDRIGATAFALLQLVGIQLYVAGDHLDGMQAKATETTSPLGDFLDHHCDYWAGCILVFAWCAMLGLQRTWLPPAMTLLMIAGFTITYAERATFRRLHFTGWGTLEMIVVATLFHGSWAIPAVRRWWGVPLWDAGWPRHAVVTALGCGVAAGVCVTIARRMRGVPWPVVVQLAALVALAAWAQRQAAPPIWGWLLVAGSGAEMVARLMHAHTTGGGCPRPTGAAVAGAVAVWGLPAGASAMAAAACGAVVAVTYGLALRRIIGGWRQHWVWVNAAGAALVLATAGVAMAPSRAAAQSSVYVPLLDPAYEDLDALAAAGLVREVMLGERPYSGAAFRRFVAEAQRRRGAGAPSPRLAEALARLAARFGAAAHSHNALAPWTLSAAVADAPARAMRANARLRGIDADLALLRQRNQGRVVPTGASVAAEAGFQLARARLAVDGVGRVVAGAGGEGTTAEVQLLGATARSVWGPVAVEVGRLPLLTGFGLHGGAQYTDNARALDQMRLRADRPLRLPGPFRMLGQWQALASVATVGRAQDQRDALLFTGRLSSRPVDALELGFTLQNMQGGSGAPKPLWWGERINDLFLFFDRKRFVDHQFSDKVFGVDLRIAPPASQGALYVNFATTDDRDFFRQPAGGYWEDAIWVAGIERRGLGPAGRLDVVLEGQHNGPNPHTHHQFTSGMTVDRRVLGNALGPDSEGLTLRLAWRAPSHRTRLSLSLERARSDSADAYPSANDPRAWDWYRLTTGPDERRQRVLLERQSEAGWRGLETTVQVGYERARRFAFGGGTRHAALLQLQLRAPRGGIRR